jgi:hypothetical protein
MKSELSERLLPIIQRATEQATDTTRSGRIKPHSSERYGHGSAVA